MLDLPSEAATHHTADDKYTKGVCGAFLVT